MSDFHTFRYKNYLQKVVRENKLVKIGSVTVTGYSGNKLSSNRAFHNFLPICAKFGVDNLYVMPLNDCEFRENRLCEKQYFAWCKRTSLRILSVCYSVSETYT
jgi:hypothetical protein